MRGDDVGLDGRRMPTRVKGLATLRRRTRAVLIATHRYARCRAATARERDEAAKLIAGLELALQESS